MTFNPSLLYSLSTIIVGIECFVMAATLFVFCQIRRRETTTSRGLVFFTIAMLLMGVINCLEFAFGDHNTPELTTLSVVVLASSVQLFLFTYAYISLLYPRLVSRNKIVLEIVLILLFTSPPLFISQTAHPTLFNIVFSIALGYYVVRMFINIGIYKKYLNRATKKINNYFSVESSSILQWINNTFYVIFTIGIISTLVPLTNYSILVAYNLFLAAAYLYIYIQIVRNIDIFNSSIKLIEVSEEEQHSKRSAGPASQRSLEAKNEELNADDDLNAPEINPRLYNRWIAKRNYVIPGITATEVALQLGTNRRILSHYLHIEYQMSFYEWIAMLRIEDAKRQLLEFSDKPIADIAASVGIEDKSNFGRTFKKLTGVSPGVFQSMNIQHSANKGS